MKGGYRDPYVFYAASNWERRNARMNEVCGEVRAAVGKLHKPEHGDQSTTSSNPKHLNLSHL